MFVFNIWMVSAELPIPFPAIQQAPTHLAEEEIPKTCIITMKNFILSSLGHLITGSLLAAQLVSHFIQLVKARYDTEVAPSAEALYTFVGGLVFFLLAGLSVLLLGCCGKGNRCSEMLLWYPFSLTEAVLVTGYMFDIAFTAIGPIGDVLTLVLSWFMVVVVGVLHFCALCLVQYRYQTEVSMTFYPAVEPVEPAGADV